MFCLKLLSSYFMKKWYKKHLDEAKKKQSVAGTSLTDLAPRPLRKTARSFRDPVRASKLKRSKTFGAG
jgi:hypothetical protein